MDEASTDRKPRTVLAAATTGFVVVAGLVALGLAGGRSSQGGPSALNASASPDPLTSIEEYKLNYCTDHPDMCPENPTVPTVTVPEWERRFEEAPAVADGSVEKAEPSARSAQVWTEADADRLFDAVQARECSEAVGTHVASQEEADALGRAQTAETSLQPALDEYWVPESHEARRAQWNAGHVAVWAYPGRHAPLECRLITFDIKRVRGDTEGIMVVVRSQNSGRYLDPNAAGKLEAQGWEVANDYLAITSVYMLTRDASGQIMLQDWDLYDDPTDPPGAGT